MLGIPSKYFSIMTDNHPYDNNQALIAFKPVRNRIRKHRPEDIVLRCMADLNRRDAVTAERIRTVQPWELLLLVKWSIIYGEYLTPDRRQLTEGNYQILRTKILGFVSNLRMPDQYEDPFLYFRNIAYQQLWFQETTMSVTLARQSILFRELEENSYLKTSFRNTNGVTIEDFIHLATVLIGNYARLPEPVITEATFLNCVGGIKKETVRSFLKILSNDFQSLKKYLEGLPLSKGHKAHEYYEQTPLRRFPLLRISDRYFVFSQIVLFHTIQTFVFDFLRDADPQEFMVHFGPLFERYVEKGLRYANMIFLKEEELRAILPKGSKVVDYYFVDHGTNFLLEAKGIEIPPSGMLTHLPDIVRGRTDASIKKAIIQAHATWAWIRNKQIIGKIEPGLGPPILIVVTFKDLFIGNGSVYMSSVAPDLHQELVDKFGIVGIIPFDRIYFISINDYDRLIEATKKGYSIAALFDKAIKDDAKLESQKFMFSQHIEPEIAHLGFPQYLGDEWNIIRRRIQQLWD
jgi:hypothetical protein